MGERGKQSKGRIDRIIQAVQDGKKKAEQEAEELQRFEQHKRDIAANLDLGKAYRGLEWYSKNHNYVFHEDPHTHARTVSPVFTNNTGQAHQHQIPPQPVYSAGQSMMSGQIYDLEMAQAMERKLAAEQEKQALLACAWCGKAMGSIEERDEHEEGCGL